MSEQLVPEAPLEPCTGVILAAVERQKVELDAGSGDLVIDTPRDLVPEAPYDLVERMRASIVVLGPLLTRVGRARVSMPGGDDFGARPIDFHLNSFCRMGAEFTTSHGYVEGLVPAGRLVGDLI